MKKIPTLFVREFENHHVVKCTGQVTPGLEWVLEAPNGENGVATIKYDGACCAIFDGVFYKRYDAKHGKTPPTGAIPCCDPDPVTGHWPHWVRCNRDDPADKWFFSAFDKLETRYDGTYEAVGPHFQGNPYGFPDDFLVKHGEAAAVVERSYDGIRRWLAEHFEEGLVFWKDGKPQCKIKRSDFGFPWPTEETARVYKERRDDGRT